LAFPKTVYIATYFPEKRLHVTKTQDELDDSTDIFKSNIERYTIRPANIPVVNKLCLAKFAAYYYKDYKTDSNNMTDSQPEVLTDDLIESQGVETGMSECLPKQIRLNNTNEHMKCRKNKAVVRYPRPNKMKEPEAYFHHLLMLYYPWRNEGNLMAHDKTYRSKFHKPDIQAIVAHNRAIFEPDTDAIDHAFETFTSNPGNMNSYDPINDQENEELQNEMQDDTFPNEVFNEQVPSHLDQVQNSHTSSGAITSYNQPTEMSDDTLHKNIRSLNTEQRHAYDIFLT
jgi:hypothetical protein